MLAETLFGVLRSKKVLGQSLQDKEITHLSHDTRDIKPQTCFIAIRGEKFDGHDYITQVIKEGVEVVVVEEIRSEWSLETCTFIQVKSTYRTQAILSNQFYNCPTEKLNVVAVTGTNGKTTTSAMISEWLTQLGHKTGLLGTLHYKVGETIYPAINTTPDALALQRLFSEMIEYQCQDAIIEASSHALQLGRLSYTAVDCAIFTNLTREHLDFHHTMQEYAHAKSLLFSQLGQVFKNGKPAVAILNYDDAYHQVMYEATSAECITYSIHTKNATVYATNIQRHAQGMTFQLNDQDRYYPVQLNMLGEYNIANFLAAYSCLVYYYGYSGQDVIEVANHFSGVSGRMQLVQKGQPFQVIVDFAHTPDAIQNVLSELSKNKSGRLFTLIGHSGGNRDSGARPEIGDIVFKYSDEIVFTADNPRHESIDKICAELIGDHEEKPYTIIHDRKQAIADILEKALPEDTVVFLGKGGEKYQVIGDIYEPYDEVAVIELHLERMQER